MLDLEGTAITDEERLLLIQPAVGGVIFFARNFVDRAQMTALAASVRAVRADLILAVDQEGGRVQRFREGFSRFPAMARLGAYLMGNPGDGENLLRDSGWLLAAELIATGIDFSFAPVLDVDDNHCAVIADRAFANDPDLVTWAARLFIEGMHEAGMAATGKHFPGHGGVTADSHLETPRDDRTLAQLRVRDLVPFVRLSAELDAVMPAHIQFPAVDSHCVGFSGYWLQDILRGQLGFDGVIFSDDLSMKGADVAGGYADKAKAALDAGCDMILVCNNTGGAREVIDFLATRGIPASGRLPRMAAKRRWNWRDLENNPRRLATRQRLEQLIAS